jgi:hypothetical protein
MKGISMNECSPESNFARVVDSRLVVPRIEDLPYWDSPPIQFVYESTANLLGGSYYWNDLPTLFTPDRPLVDNAVYFFRSVSLIAEIDEIDFESNITAAPQFYTFLTADAKSVLFREPIVMNKYYTQFDYRLVWSRARGANQLMGAFTGALLQGPALIGKTSITLKGIISAQEIVNEQFNELLRQKSYPARGRA